MKLLLTNVCSILQQEMALADGQVMIYNQKRNIPETTNLWITVGILSNKPFGNTSHFDNGIEVQSVNMGAALSIDIMSRDDSALERNEEILMALGSSFSQSIQEKYAFKIARTPTSFVNLSQIEGPSIPFRFNITMQVIYMVTKKKTIPFYDTFKNSVVVRP